MRGRSASTLGVASLVTVARLAAATMVLLMCSTCGGQSGPGSADPPTIRTERGFLEDGATEGSYGLYSYVLFWAEPANDDERDRYKATLDAYCSMIAQSGTYRVEPERINMTYVPVREPVYDCRSDLILPRYSYTRAKRLLSKLEGNHFVGPYIVTTEDRLSKYTARPNVFFMQDMTDFPPQVIRAYVREFLGKARTREDLWDNQTDFVLWARTRVEQIADSIPDAEIAAEKIKLAMQFFRSVR